MEYIWRAGLNWQQHLGWVSPLVGAVFLFARQEDFLYGHLVWLAHGLANGKPVRSRGAASTVHDRFQEWRPAQVFERLWQEGDGSMLPVLSPPMRYGGGASRHARLHSPYVYRKS